MSNDQKYCRTAIISSHDIMKKYSLPKEKLLLHRHNVLLIRGLQCRKYNLFCNLLYTPAAVLASGLAFPSEESLRNFLVGALIVTNSSAAVG